VGFHIEELISISCIGRSPAILRELLDESRNNYLKLIQNKTPVFENRDGRWKKMKAREIRPISTVIMDEKDKAGLLADIGAFLKDQSWYSTRGIPYRRGYLLYGPPGTGKSTLSLAVAGHFDLEIYIVNLSSVSGSTLSDLFADLPHRCIVLLEDVDAVNMTRPRQVTAKSSRSEESTRQLKPKGGLSLSELLNILDGVSSQDGRVLIMTTNHIQHLDRALIRPGRADKKLELPNASRDMATRLFKMIFRTEKTKDDQDLHEANKTVEELAQTFTEKLCEWEFSPAEIQCFLLENRDSPYVAVQKVEEWIVNTRKEKAKGAEEAKLVVPRDEVEGYIQSTSGKTSGIQGLGALCGTSPCMDSYLTKLLMSAVEMLWAATNRRSSSEPGESTHFQCSWDQFVANYRSAKAVTDTPPPSESEESTCEDPSDGHD
jgi:mitochondrial chaperone BCS1